MTGPSSSEGSNDLNFDRAEAGSGTGSTAANECANCSKPLGETYYTVNGASICPSCRGRLESATAPVRSPVTLAKAIALGFGAAVVGAIIYYGVMRYLNLEIGLVAILTGWMVGKAMSRATAGRGGRLMQASAAVLTYVSVAMAYFPFAVQQLGAESEGSVTAQSPAAPTETAPTTVEPTPDEPPAAVVEQSAAFNPFFALVVLAGFALILPILVIAGSMPGGLISAAIIGFGMMQAWQLTAAPRLVFEGPFRLAPNAGAGNGGGAPS